MPPELAAAVEKLLATEPGDSTSPEVLADRATRACEQLAHHLARLLGDTAIRALFERSLVLAGAQFSWLASAQPPPGETGDHAWSVLRSSLEHQDPDTAREAFALILSTLVGLLKRLIGERLAERLLREVWPLAFRMP